MCCLLELNTVHTHSFKAIPLGVSRHVKTGVKVKPEPKFKSAS